MDQARPKKSRIDLAGDILAERKPASSECSLADAQNIVGQWRSEHMLPLNRTLNLLAPFCDNSLHAILTGRLKRLESIVGKLRRTNTRLVQMQDIAGCRLIMQEEEDILQAVTWACTVGAEQGIKTGILKDYMRHPKTTGYRGIHLLCRHKMGTLQNSCNKFQ